MRHNSDRQGQLVCPIALAINYSHHVTSPILAWLVRDYDSYLFAIYAARAVYPDDSDRARCARRQQAYTILSRSVLRSLHQVVAYNLAPTTRLVAGPVLTSWQTQFLCRYSLFARFGRTPIDGLNHCTCLLKPFSGDPQGLEW